MSVSRRQANRRSAQPLISRSPAAWPKLSLISLKRSRSRHSTAAIVWRRRHSASACSSRSRSSSRLGSPVIAIVPGGVPGLRLGLELGGDVGGGAAIAPEVALGIDDRLARDAQRLLLVARPRRAGRADRGTAAAPPRSSRWRVPALGILGRVQQLGQGAAEHRLAAEAGDRLEALRDELDPELARRSPRSSRSSPRRCRESGSRRTGSWRRRAGCCASPPTGEGGEHEQRADQPGHHPAQQLPPGRSGSQVRQPEPGAVRRDQRDRARPAPAPGGQQLQAAESDSRPRCALQEGRVEPLGEHQRRCAGRAAGSSSEPACGSDRAGGDQHHAVRAVQQARSPACGSVVRRPRARPRPGPRRARRERRERVRRDALAVDRRVERAVRAIDDERVARSRRCRGRRCRDCRRPSRDRTPAPGSAPPRPTSCSP